MTFTNGISHTSGIEGAFGDNDEYIDSRYQVYVEGIDGQKLKTDFQMWRYKKWFEKIIEEKREIAQKAASFISEGECIILDSGSTTTEIAKLLTQYKELTVITNALNIALILGENPGINLIVTGGEFKAPTLSLTGKMAADSLKGFHANKLFLATAGISPDMSLTYPSLSDLMVKSAMIKAAEEVILVADSSKIGISAFASLGSISMVNSFITDSNISEENIEKMKEKNINLLIG